MEESHSHFLYPHAMKIAYIVGSRRHHGSASPCHEERSDESESHKPMKTLASRIP